MPGISCATQTETEDRLKAIQLRLSELKRVLPKCNESRPKQSVNCTPSKKEGRHIMKHNQLETISIGPNQTRVDRAVLERIDWDSHSLATRALLDAVFDKETLATRNISGTKLESMSRKRCMDYVLDPLKVSDIIQLVHRKCKVSEPAIRKIITIKCSDTANTKRFKKNI